MDFGGTAMMGGGGPMITGNWINLKTGEQVTVRDSFMDGDDMVIMLTNGKQMTLDDFQDYVQQSDEEYDEKGNMISMTNGGGIQKPGKPSHKVANVDASTVFAGMDDKVDVGVAAEPPASDLEEVLGTAAPRHQKMEEAIPEGLKAASQIIHRSSSPKFKVSVEWDGFPKEELLMAKKFFDTTDDDIAKAIIGMHCTGHELESAVVEWVVEALKND